MALPHGTKRRFTDEQIREIRSVYSKERAEKKYWSEERMNLTNLAEKYGVTKGAISHILTRRTYKHVS